jgi:hypothetical protein
VVAQETAQEAAGGVSGDTCDLTIAPGSTVTARSRGLSTNRVATLTDGVFAIVLTLRLPDLRAAAAKSQPRLLRNGATSFRS